MLKWFVDEQVEEEETAQDIIDKLEMIGDNGYGLYMLDKELGAAFTLRPLHLPRANEKGLWLGVVRLLLIDGLWPGERQLRV